MIKSATTKPTVAQVRDANGIFFNKGNVRFFAGRAGREKYAIIRSKDKLGWILRIQRTRVYKPGYAFSRETTMQETCFYEINPETLELGLLRLVPIYKGETT